MKFELHKSIKARVICLFCFCLWLNLKCFLYTCKIINNQCSKCISIYPKGKNTLVEMLLWIVALWNWLSLDHGNKLLSRNAGMGPRGPIHPPPHDPTEPLWRFESKELGTRTPVPVTTTTSRTRLLVTEERKAIPGGELRNLRRGLAQSHSSLIFNLPGLLA